MPLVEISMIDGRTAEKKAELIKEVTKTVCRVLGSEPPRVRVIIRDVPPENWGVAGVPKSQG